MNEAEAKTKICPILFAPFPTAIGAKDPRSPQGKCIGSACLMWRWHLQVEAQRDNPPGDCGLVRK